MRGAAGLLAAALLLVPLPARAAPTVWRVASTAPDGTAWARELRAFGREIAELTRGAVQIKWYLSGVAGDELAAERRLGRGQLDGVVSGGMLCARLSPTQRALGMAGRFPDRDEAAWVLGRLKPALDDEYARLELVNLIDAGLGFSVLFTRRPLRSLAEIGKERLWLWGLDDMLGTQLPAMGLDIARLPIEEGYRAYEEGRIGGFITLPTAALAYQWSTEARYVIDLRVGFLTGCFLMARRAFDPLPLAIQREVRAAAAKLAVRVDALSREQDDALLGGLLAKQGLIRLPPPPELVHDFAAAAERARALGERLVPASVLGRVTALQAEYRRQHR